MPATLIQQEPPHPPAEDGRLPAALAGLIAGYPGLALVLDRGGRRRAGNRDAGALDAEALDRIGDSARAASALGGNAVVALALADGRALEITLTALEGPGGSVLALGRDVTRERNLHHALVESRQRYKDFATRASDVLWETGADGAFTFVTPAEVLGWAADALVGRRPSDLIDRSRGGRWPPPFERDIPAYDEDVWIVTADESSACIQVSSVPIIRVDGTFGGARGVWRDITKARAREDEAIRHRRIDATVAEIVARIREDGPLDDILERAAAALAEELGACRAFVRWRDHRGANATAAAGTPLAPEAEQWIDGELDTPMTAHRTASGAAVHFAVTRCGRDANGTVAIARAENAAPWNDEAATMLARLADHVGLAIEQFRAHQSLRELALTDGLTGLLNRRAFDQEVGRRISMADRNGTAAALLYVDLDHFKAVNDRLGHPRGDAALIDVARLLVEQLRHGDVAARLGGDEFAVWCDGMPECTATARAEALVAAAARLRTHSPSDAPPLGLSVGVTQYRPGSGESLEAVIARADAALYQAKRNGRGRVAVAPATAEVATSATRAP